MRIIAALPLLLAACGPGEEAGNSVDINAAARQAQGSIDNYAASTATPATRPGPPAASSEGSPAGSPIVMPSPGPTPAPSEVAPTPSAPGTPGGLPDDRTPVSEARFTLDSAQGAADVVQTYYALLGERKYRQAWALWDHDGKDSGMTAAAFAASFDKYTEYRANVGAPGEVDAGMSQRWVTVPVQVYGRLRTGKPFDMRGTVQLHRIAEGVGAPAGQQRWHIRSADIPPRPAG